MLIFFLWALTLDFTGLIVKLQKYPKSSPAFEYLKILFFLGGLFVFFFLPSEFLT